MAMRILVLALCMACLAPTAAAQPSADYRLQTVVRALSHPWALAFLPDGRALLTERSGRLRLIVDGVLLEEPVAGLPRDIFVAGEAGLLDVAVDPAFAATGFVYLTLSHGDRDANATRVVRGRLVGARLEDVRVLFESRPRKRGSVHNGGRLAVLADGSLVIAIGEGSDRREAAQDPRSHLGKLVRIAADGTVPPDNPFVGRADAAPEVYTLGHRNVQGLARVDGVLYASEHGPRGGDEFNRIEAGANYGWPLATHGLDYTWARVSPFTTLPGHVDPRYVWTSAIAPSGLLHYDGALFPEWRGDLFVPALVGRSVRRLRIDVNGEVIEEEVLFRELGARIRTLAQAPDGALWLVTDGPAGRVVRVGR